MKNHPPPSKSGAPHYHLVGVAGVGMSALAQVLQAQGCVVSGSDRYHDEGQELAVLAKLRQAAITLVPQDGSGITSATAGVIVSSAIEADNPDISAARQTQVPVIHRAEMLARLTAGKRTVAVTGTAGKTTVTGMIGWALARMQADPTVVNGGAVLNWLSAAAIGNVRCGASDLWVLEVDESDRSLLKFSPDWAVITNISKDHFELAEVEALFRKFAGQVRRAVVGCLGSADDRQTIGNFEPRLTADGSAFRYHGVDFSIPLLGRHNAENALHSAMLCERLGFDLRAISVALRDFKGIQRRLELAGRAAGVTVIDDYAHNPAKIAAAWRSVAPYYRRVLAVWRPHGYGPLALMKPELIETFANLAQDSDRVFILPVFYAGGTAEQVVTSEQLVRELQQRHVPAEYAPGYADLQADLLRQAESGDVVLLMGARDPELPLFAHRLVAQMLHFLVKRMP